MLYYLILLISTLSLVANAAPADGIVNVVVNGKTYQAKEGYFLVRHKSGIRSESTDQINIRANAVVQKRFAYPAGLELVKVKTGVSATSAMNVYKQSADILYVEPDYIWRANELPNDSLFNNQWALRNSGQSGGSTGSDINAIDAWSLTRGTHDVVLGTIDTGVDYTHPDLKNNMWTNTQEIPGNGIDDDRDGYIDDVHGINAIDLSGDPMDDNMHGTHVAGIIAAQQNNGIGISGVAPNVSVSACKFLDASGSGDTAGAILCLNYYRALATRPNNPVNIIATNNSWAGGPYSQALYDAIKANQDAGILFMAAASNEGENNDSVETYPANFYLPNLISVAATDNRDRLANFSNYGKVSVAVAAPGVDILSTVPNGKYAYLNGTSMATPHVTGLAGLIASYRPSLSWIGIKNLILTGGESVSGATGSTYTGRRILAAGPNGTGSLTCSNQKIVKRVWPRASTVTVKLGQSIALGILSVQCEYPTITVGGMSAAAAAASPIRLTDTGTGIDQVASDGIFSGTWTPTSRGTFRLAFPGNDIVTVKVQ